MKSKLFANIILQIMTTTRLLEGLEICRHSVNTIPRGSYALVIDILISIGLNGLVKGHSQFIGLCLIGRLC